MAFTIRTVILRGRCCRRRWRQLLLLLLFYYDCIRQYVRKQTQKQSQKKSTGTTNTNEQWDSTYNQSYYPTNFRSEQQTFNSASELSRCEGKLKVLKEFQGTQMDDVAVSSSFESGLSMLLSACAPPLSLDDDFSLGWDCLDRSKDVKSDSLDGFDSLANSPLSHLTAESESSSPSSFGCSVSSLNLDCDVSLPTFSYDELPSPLLGFPDPAAPALSIAGESFEMTAVPARRPTMVRKRTHECSMVCWLFRTLLTSEYRALPLNAIFEIFEDTNPSSAHGRHWRQSIRHCLMSSAVFVRVLTPNPRKDFLVMNEAGSWWTVHPDCEAACADEVFRPGLAHRCPPNGGGSASRMKMYQVDDTSEIIYRDSNRGKWANDRIYARRRPQERPKKQSMPLRPSSISLFSMKPASQFPIRHTAHVNPHRGDHLVVDHEEEVS